MKEKLIYWLTVLLIIFLPTQIGRHFWYDGALIMGRRIDYLAPVIYLTDIIVVFLFITLWATTLGKLGRLGKLGKLGKPTLLLLGIWFTGSLWAAQNKIITAWYFLKIAEYVWLGWFLMARIGLIRQISPMVRLRSPQVSQIWQFLAIPVIYESVLATWQVIGQKSVGGIWWWLGERSFSVATPGIAQFVWQGELFLRGYGTFSHPNVLAGFLLISLILVKNIPRSGIPNLVGIKIIKNIKIITIIIALIGIFVSGSRLIWGLAAAWGALGLLGKLGRLGKFVACFVLCIMCLFLVFPYVNFSDPSIILRLKLNSIAWQMFTDHWLFGVGLMNFVGQLPNYTRDFEVLKFLQPAHNVFLLAASEIGLIGLICLIGLIWLKRRAIFARKNLFLLSVIVVISLFDHYFWTTQQGQLIILLVFVKFISGFNDREQINKVE